MKVTPYLLRKFAERIDDSATQMGFATPTVETMTAWLLDEVALEMEYEAVKMREFAFPKGIKK